MMTAFFSRLLDIATLVFAVSSMLSVGFSYTLRELIEPLRNARLVIGALAANFVLVPLLAYAITAFLSLGEAREIGLLLVATAAGAPFVIKLTQAADGDLALAAGLLVLLVVVTIGYMPIVVPLIAPEAAVSARSIATPLVLTMLLPLGIGLFVDARFEGLADRLQPIMNKVSTAALVVLLVTTVLTNGGRLLDVVGTGAILAALLFIAGAFIIGYLLGMTGRGTREELGLATAQRNIAAATVVATQSFGDPDTLVMVVVTSLIAMVILFPLAGALRKHQEKLDATRSRHASPRRKEPLF
jgi:BASS family bile acid:Na+ symporter